MSKYKITDQPQEVQDRIYNAMNEAFFKARPNAYFGNGFKVAIEWAMNNLVNEGQHPDFSSELDRLIEKWEGKAAMHMDLGMASGIWENLVRFHHDEWNNCNVVLSVLRELKEAVEKGQA